MSAAITFPAWLQDEKLLEERLAWDAGHGGEVTTGVREALAEGEEAIAQAEEYYYSECEIGSPDDAPPSFLITAVWAMLCRMLRHLQAFPPAPDVSVTVPRRDADRQWRAVARQVRDHAERIAELMRVVLVSKPGWNLVVPDDLVPAVWTVRISTAAYCRAMWNLFWSAIRHPLSETTIDLSTGRVLYRT